MGKRNKNITEMYSLYKDGYSLEQVGKVYGCTRQSVHGLFKYNNLKMRPNKKPLPFLFFNGAKYTLRNNGYYGKTNGKRTLMHRDMWEHYNGKIKSGYDIHHIDLNRENNNIDNLECLLKSEHTRLYSPHNNQYTKGRKK